MATLSPAIADEGDVPVELRGGIDSVKGLLYARPFTLETPYRYEWTAEKPGIDSGLILVLDVDKEFAKPRQVGVPVLYVGDTPAELANVGYESGHMIVIVPGAVDLLTAPVFFGSEQLPERVDREHGSLELQEARALGIVPFPRSMVESALALGGDSLAAAGAEELFVAVADLIDTYSPDEGERADLYRISPTNENR
jgi:hypothetical protein